MEKLESLKQREKETQNKLQQHGEDIEMLTENTETGGNQRIEELLQQIKNQEKEQQRYEEKQQEFQEELEERKINNNEEIIIDELESLSENNNEQREIEIDDDSMSEKPNSTAEQVRESPRNIEIDDVEMEGNGIKRTRENEYDEFYMPSNDEEEPGEKRQRRNSYEQIMGTDDRWDELVRNFDASQEENGMTEQTEDEDIFRDLFEDEENVNITKQREEKKSKKTHNKNKKLARAKRKCNN